MRLLGVVPGKGVVVSVTGSSVAGTVDCSGSPGYNAIHVANTSATLYVQVRAGAGAQTATTSDIAIPPLGQLLIGANAATTGVAGIGSAAGPTAVIFTPVRIEG